jgi:hypothetical protein
MGAGTSKDGTSLQPKKTRIANDADVQVDPVLIDPRVSASSAVLFFHLTQKCAIPQCAVVLLVGKWLAENPPISVRSRMNTT